MRLVIIFVAASTVAAAANGFASAEESFATMVVFLGSCLAAAGLIRPAVELWDRFITRPKREAQDRLTNALASMETRYETLRKETKADIDSVHRRIDLLPSEIAQLLKVTRHETDPAHKS